MRLFQPSLRRCVPLEMNPSRLCYQVLEVAAALLGESIQGAGGFGKLSPD
jgi:hypothetical protein